MTGGARLFGRHRRGWVIARRGPARSDRRCARSQPPALSGAAAVEPWTFAALASAAIVTLAILPFLVGRTAARPRAWVAMAVVSLALGLASFAIGGYAQRACTARYGERSVVIGTDLTALGGFISCRHCSLEDSITDIAVRYVMPLCCELSGLMLS